MSGELDIMSLELQREVWNEIKFCVVGMYLVPQVMRHPTSATGMKMDKNEERPRTGERPRAGEH